MWASDSYHAPVPMFALDCQLGKEKYWVKKLSAVRILPHCHLVTLHFPVFNEYSYSKSCINVCAERGITGGSWFSAMGSHVGTWGTWKSWTMCEIFILASHNMFNVKHLLTFWWVNILHIYHPNTYVSKLRTLYLGIPGGVTWIPFACPPWPGRSAAWYSVA